MDSQQSHSAPLQHHPEHPRAKYSRFGRTLSTIEMFVGAIAGIAGTLLLIRPDGSLLGASITALAATSFENWRIPGLLLAVLVGGGFLVAGITEWRAAPAASALSASAGTALIAFEVVEMAMIGWHPLQPVMIVVGLLIVLMVNLRVAEERASRRTAQRKPSRS